MQCLPMHPLVKSVISLFAFIGIQKIKSPGGTLFSVTYLIHVSFYHWFPSVFCRLLTVFKPINLNGEMNDHLGSVTWCQMWDHGLTLLFVCHRSANFTLVNILLDVVVHLQPIQTFSCSTLTAFNSQVAGMDGLYNACCCCLGQLRVHLSWWAYVALSEKSSKSTRNSQVPSCVSRCIRLGVWWSWVCGWFFPFMDSRRMEAAICEDQSDCHITFRVLLFFHLSDGFAIICWSLFDWNVHNFVCEACMPNWFPPGNI